MADFTAKDVQALRRATGAGMMDAKRALEANDGDSDIAAQWLREHGIAKAASRSDRENAEGAVAAAVIDGSAAIVELKSETDFVAKSDDFTALVEELALLVAKEGPEATGAKAGAIEDMRITLKENIELGRVVHYDVGSGSAVDAYVHRQAGRGVNAVLVEVAGGDVGLAHELALHVASSRPQYLARDDVPADLVEAERQTLETLSRNEGKPEAALDKIVTGRLTGWFREHTLLDQNFVKDEKKSITQLLGGATITRFDQVEIGS
jgi:elongation factor Ts